MKHKKDSTTLSRIVNAFEHSDADVPTAIQRFPSGLPPRLLLSSHFEILMMHLTNESLPEDVQNCFIQEYVQPVGDTRYLIQYRSDQLTTTVESFSQHYLINGKYQLQATFEAAEPPLSLSVQTKDIVKHLEEAYQRPVHAGAFEWIQVPSGDYVLLGVTDLEFAMQLATLEDTIPEPTQTSAKAQRPPSVPRRDYRIRKGSVNTPRGSETFKRTPSNASSRNRTMRDTPRLYLPDTRNKANQTEGECCSCKAQMERCMVELVKERNQVETLQEHIRQLQQRHALELQQVNDAWKDKLFEVCHEFNKQCNKAS